MSEPKTAQAGTTIEWSRSISDYSSDDGYSAEYVLINYSDRFTVTVDATLDGNDIDVEVTNATSATWVPGHYQWNLYVTKTGERRHIDSGFLDLTPNLSGAAVDGYDPRSHNRKVLDALKAMQEGRVLQGDAASLSIQTGNGSRSISLLSPEEILIAIQRYESRVDREEIEADLAAGKTTGAGKIYIRNV